MTDQDKITALGDALADLLDDEDIDDEIAAVVVRSAPDSAADARAKEAYDYRHLTKVAQGMGFEDIAGALTELVRLRGADGQVQRLLKAATTYAEHYVQDEADPGYGPDDLVCSEGQHERAKELFAAIEAMQSTAGEPT